MKKLIICIITFLLIACGNEISEANQEEETVITDNTAESAIINEIDVWDIEPVYSLDDIDSILYGPIESFAFEYGEMKIHQDNFYGPFKKGGIKAKKDGKYGVLDESGNIVIPFIYDKFDGHQESGWNEFGRFPTEGAEVLCPNYETIKMNYTGGYGGPGRYMYYLDDVSSLYRGFYMYYDNSLNDISKMNTSDIVANYTMFQDSRAFGRYSPPSTPTGIDANASIAFQDYYNHRIVIANGNQGYYLTGSGEYAEYKLGGFSNQMVLLADSEYDYQNEKKIVNKICYIDLDGNNIGTFERGYGFTEGYAAVKFNGKWGYIDKEGNNVVDYIFDKATPLNDGKAWVMIDGRVGRLNLLNLINSEIKINAELLNVASYDITNVDYTKTVYPMLTVKVANLNIRVSPNTDADKWPDKAIEGFQYSYYETEESGGYTWYRIGQDQWIADNGEWVELQK